MQLISKVTFELYMLKTT